MQPSRFVRLLTEIRLYPATDAFFGSDISFSSPCQAVFLVFKKRQATPEL